MYRLRFASLFLAGFIVLACSQIAQTATLVVGIAADIISEDPSRSQRHRETDLVLSLLYEPLIGDHGGIQYGPGLASSFRQLSSVQWEFNIDPKYGISARQVAEALERAFGENGLDGLPSPARSRLAIRHALPVSDFRVIVQLESPTPSLPTILSQEPIAALEDHKLIHTGKFEWERREPGNRVVLTRRIPVDDLPERVVFEIIPSVSERISRLVVGQIDAVPWLPWSSVQQLANADVIELLAVPGTRSYFIEMNTRRAPFNDRNVRRALNLAIDIPKMLDDVYQGIGYATPTIVAPTTFGYMSDLDPIGYDTAEAKALLEMAGYPNGFHFELDTLPSRLAEAKAIAAMWQEIGVTAHIRVWPDWTTLRTALLTGDRFAWMAEWDNTSLDPGSVLRAKASRFGAANYGGYNNPSIDRLLTLADGVGVGSERLSYYQQIQTILRDDAAFVFGYTEELIMAQRVGTNACLLFSGTNRSLNPRDSGGC